jgi:hypothetical protein
MLMMLVVLNVRMCGREGGERGWWGPDKGAKIGQLTLSRGPARAEVCLLIQRDTIPSKRVSFTLVNTIHLVNIIYLRVTLCI